ncbi:hypothetical protein NIES4075_66400 [Tolypothrix sp. NIES-4075]|nr:hypothetical protein NIES4075_66400 [Tolypothrix sp. NIES-4075]
MWVILALTLYTLYLGIQISRLRSANEEVKDKLVDSRFPVKHYQMGSISATAYICLLQQLS